jgi:hypothetical protein
MSTVTAASNARHNSMAFAGWAGFAFGAPGAMLLALNVSWSGWGWLAFLGSNIAWIAYAARAKTWSLLLQQLVFLVTTLVGIARWLG